MKRAGKAEVKRKPRDYYKNKLKQFMNSTPFSMFMSVLTIYTIFAIDIDKGFFTRDASFYFSCVHLVSMFIFTLEIICTTQVNADYAFHFYFWIDVFSTLTMLLEIIWIEDLMNSVDNIKVAISFARVSKASRFSKIGARSTKIMKLIRLIKLIKFIDKDDKQQNANEPNYNEVQETNPNQMFDSLEANKNKFQLEEVETGPYKISHIDKFSRPNVDQEQQRAIEQRWLELHNEMADSNLEGKEDEVEGNTKVGEILKNEIQKNIVLMVMGVIIIIPMLSADTWYTKTASFPFLVENYIVIADKLNYNQTTRMAWLEVLLQCSVNISDPLVYMKTAEINYPDNYSIKAAIEPIGVDQLRLSEKIAITNKTYEMIYSKKRYVQITAWINIGRSIFITLLLVFASIFFIKDLETYALHPLEKMSSTVLMIEKNPFAWIEKHIEDEEENQVDNNEQEPQLETNILENLIIKMANLLASGVGETPSKLITQEIEQNDLNTSEEGTMEIEGTFMCVQLANFYQISEALGEQAIQYINTVIEIIHETAIENGGYIFYQDETYTIICWKNSSEEVTEKSNNLVISKKTLEKYKLDEKKLADQAYFAYLKMQEKLNLSPLMKKYNILSRTISDYDEQKIHVGFNHGLAYCGPVGSEFKLTLKAMGRDIAIARCLCKMAKIYCVNHLLSKQVVELSDFCRQFSRKVQQITFMEEKYEDIHRSLEVYKCDVKLKSGKKFVKQLESKHGQLQKVGANEKLMRRYLKKIFKTRQQTLQNIEKLRIEELLGLNLASAEIFKFFHFEEWLQNWKEGMEAYEEGQWATARISFEISKDLYPKRSDIFAEMKLKQISSFKDEPAPGWKMEKEVWLYF